MANLVYGVGINDASYNVTSRDSGKLKFCPFYSAWVNMLKRCYSDQYKSKNPSYYGCEVCTDWLRFSNFREWMKTQEWEGKQLDKDLLKAGNKKYRPELCCFLTSHLNKFIQDGKNKRGKFLVGVHYRPEYKKFASSCRDGVKKVHLGYFDSEYQAHQAWKAFKTSLARKLAKEQTDKRISKALIELYN